MIDSELVGSTDFSGRGTARAKDAPGTPTESHISPSILLYEDERGAVSQVQAALKDLSKEARESLEAMLPLLAAAATDPTVPDQVPISITQHCGCHLCQPKSSFSSTNRPKFVSKERVGFQFE